MVDVTGGDPMERIVADALTAAGVQFVTPSPTNLDFRLVAGIEIEVKRFHSPRIAAQMSRAENVIALQGEAAVKWFASLLAAADAYEQAALVADYAVERATRDWRLPAAQDAVKQVSQEIGDAIRTYKDPWMRTLLIGRR